MNTRMEYAMKKQENYTRNFVFLYLIQYTTFAMISSQRQSFLNDMGYSLTERSLIFAMIPIMTIVMQLLVGFLSDKYDTVKKIIIPLVIGSALTSYLFYSVTVQLYVFHFAIALLSQSFVVSATDLMDVWVLESDGASKNSYGFIRAFGSLGWSLGSFFIARIVFMAGYEGLGLTILLLSILIMILSITIVDNKKQRATHEVKQSVKINDIVTLFKDKHYLLAIMVVFAANLAVGLAGFTVVEKMLTLGANTFDLSNRNMIAAGVEVPLMLIGDQVYRKMGSVKMLLIAISVHTLQFVGYMIAPSNTHIILITLGQVISVPFFNIAIKYLLMHMSPADLKATGQMSGPAIVNGVHGFIHPLIAALLINNYTVNAPFIISIMLGLIGIYLVLMIRKNESRGVI